MILGPINMVLDDTDSDDTDLDDTDLDDTDLEDLHDLRTWMKYFTD